MNSADIKKLVRQFRREYGTRNPDADFLVNVFEKQGYTLIEFNSLLTFMSLNVQPDMKKCLSEGNRKYPKYHREKVFQE